jgi:hypothetical protein
MTAFTPDVFIEAMTDIKAAMLATIKALSNATTLLNESKTERVTVNEIISDLQCTLKLEREDFTSKSNAKLAEIDSIKTRIMDYGRQLPTHIVIISIIASCIMTIIMKVVFSI